MRALALVERSRLISLIMASKPCWAQSCAIPAPMFPAPTTRIFLTAIFNSPESRVSSTVQQPHRPHCLSGAKPPSKLQTLSRRFPSNADARRQLICWLFQLRCIGREDHLHDTRRLPRGFCIPFHHEGFAPWGYSLDYPYAHKTFYFLVSFLPFFSALFSFKLLAGFFFPSFLVSMFLLMMFPSVFPAGAGTLDYPAGTKNAFSGQKRFRVKNPNRKLPVESGIPK